MAALFPATRAHEGIWEGTYHHLNEAGEIVDVHASRVICEFPSDAGQVFYRQHIEFSWDDGRIRRDRFDGIVDGTCLRYDTPTFSGRSWETEDGLLLLNLQRKDEPGAMFYEIIAMGATGEHRARTWHWFRDGKLYRRTLCDERRIS